MRKLSPGAILGMILVITTSGMSKDIINGYQLKRHRVEKTTAEPMLFGFLECWFYPFPWCTPPDPPKLAPPQPDVPAGCCSDTCIGPCQ